MAFVCLKCNTTIEYNMRRLVFATNNRHKLAEVRAALQGKVEVVSLAEVGLAGDIPETADTLEGNAQQKAQWVWERVHGERKAEGEKPFDGVFADDTGLEVNALGGAPGVYSARYAGEGCSFSDNVEKLLKALQGVTDRRADFRTVICLMEGSEPTVRFFEGRVDGQILEEPRSNGEGFGYDPVFMPERFAVSFAEMPLEVKNQISHRGRAVAQLAAYLL